MSRFHQHHREPDHVVWSELPPVYWKAFGIALLLGFVTGLGWIGWKVFEAYVVK